MQAVNAVLYGKYTMEGDQFDTVEVDFGRSEGNNIEQADGKKWSEQDVIRLIRRMILTSTAIRPAAL